MIQYKVKGTTYNVPTSLADISWKDLLAFYAIKVDDTIKTFFKIGHIVSLLVKGFDYKDVEGADAGIIIQMYEQLVFLFEDMEELTQERSTTITIGDVTYQLHDLTTFYEFATYAQVEQSFKHPYQAVPMQLAHLLRLPGETIPDLTEAMIAERTELFANADAESVIKLHNFFLFRKETLLKATKVFSRPMDLTTQEKETLLNDCLKNMAGLTQPQNFVMKTLRNMIVSLVRKRMKYYSGLNLA